MGSGQRENGASAPTSVSYRFVRMRRTEERWGFRCGDRRHAEIDCGNKNRCDLDGRFDIRGFLASRSYPCVWVVRANAEAAGLPDATPAAIMQILKSRKMFSAVVGPEEAIGRKPLVEISADLVDFAPGNVATRIIVGLGTGRAHAGFNFAVKEPATGRVLWKKTIKETASFWSRLPSARRWAVQPLCGSQRRMASTDRWACNKHRFQKCDVG